MQEYPLCSKAVAIKGLTHMKLILLFALCALFLAPAAHAKQSELNLLPEIKSSFNCFVGPFETFDTWINFLKSKNPNFNEDRFPFKREQYEAYRNTLNCLIFDYFVDDVVVQGYVIYPKESNKPLPTLIYNRGGNTSFGRMVMGSMQYNLMPIAAEGFVIIGSQYRWDGTRKQSEFKANGNNDEFGGVDVNDVLALVPIIKKLPFASHENLGVMGTSRGGMQSYLFAKRYPDIKAMVIESGISNAYSFYERDDATKNLLATLIPNFKEQKDLALTQRSAVFWVDQLPKAPIMLIHAEDDERVDFSNASVMAALLEQRDRPYTFLRFPDGGHGLAKHKDKVDSNVVSFFKTHLQ
jgi:dipeptidyl aminopeptidase/acylaminoacyl peptidase